MSTWIASGILALIVWRGIDLYRDMRRAEREADELPRSWRPVDRERADAIRGDAHLVERARRAGL